MRRTIWLSLLVAAIVTAGSTVEAAPRINAPYFSETVPFSQAAVSWFGKVESQKNYTDVRVAYTATELWITLSVADQWLYVDEAATRTPASLEQWDAATLLLDTSAGATTPGPTCYRFVGELNSWRPRTDYQAAYVGSGGAWTALPSSSLTTEAGWRGDALNNSAADRGWTITFHVPFSSLGLAGPPAAGAVWRLGFIVHDKDTAASGTTVTSWPEPLVRDQPSTWGELAFGLRTYPVVAPPSSAQTYTVRHNLDGATVIDAMVGGGSTCGTSDYFNTSGNLNYAGSTTLVVQNQRDIADWPCFSKTFFEFPLTALPPGKVVISASLTVYQFGGSDPSQAQRSLVQLLTVDGAWNESTITWNNAPAPGENVSQTWVDVIPSQLPWPGAARTWDLSWAVASAYGQSSPVLRLAAYEADAAYHSGKYFTSSDTGEWNAVGRPTLQIVLADPPPRPPTNVRIVR